MSLPPKSLSLASRSIYSSCGIFRGHYIVPWEVEHTHEFGAWWAGLTRAERKSVGVCVGLLEIEGPHLAFPYSSRVARSWHRHMRELRAQHEGRPYRVLYAFDPRRVAILLYGGRKTRDRLL